MLEVCDQCGTPLFVANGLKWGDNGTITLASSPKNRMVFFESELIDHLFAGIGELLGIPLGHLVIESRARETKRYIERLFPPEIRQAMAFKTMSGKDGAAVTAVETETQLAAIKGIAQTIIDISRVYGYGDQRPSDLWDSGGKYAWRTQVIRNPYSLLFIAGDNVGSVEVFEESEMRVNYEEIEKDAYKIEVFPGKHSIALKERLQRKFYDFKPGEITYEQCPQCAVPLEVANRKWNCVDGTYTDPETGRRMAIFGPAAFDAVLVDLEYELGEIIPQAIIDAQRKYLKEAWSGEWWNRSSMTFQHMLAIRGLGEMVTFDGDKTHLTLNIQNACLPLPMIGTVQALVEMAYRTDNSTCEWEFKDDGDLNITVTVD
ncbi:MAG: hypothetical protein A2Y75_06135 [Candidatus Solincola sediminis]|uniref:Uncharacterized protein n=1 Tax=Candidatus Solincola sediminis TaxID=1797199 RepID=A0A1F2WKG1_9ACTN|nr:MAG: hypothetical protein A2Y75_06135 [Candidatus Solincola sediminis]